MLSFIITFNFTDAIWFFCVDSSECLVSFICSLKIFLYFLKSESAGKKFSQFLLTWRCLHFTFILEGSFSGYKMICGQFFFFF